MTRDQYKRAKLRWILEPIVGIAFFVLMMFLAGCAAYKVVPL